MTSTRELTTKTRTVLALIIANPGTKVADLCRGSHYTMDCVQGTITWLMHEGFVLRAYDTYPPCTYWATQRGVETHKEQTT